MRYITITITCYCIALKRIAKMRITYQVTALRDGLEKWFKLSEEVVE